MGTRFLCDEDMLDTDDEPIKALAALHNMTPDEMLSDTNPKDWFIDMPPGAQVQVRTGQESDPGLLDIAHAEYPFTSDSSPSHTDFLNYNDGGNEQWRKDLISDCRDRPFVVPRL